MAASLSLLSRVNYGPDKGNYQFIDRTSERVWYCRKVGKVWALTYVKFDDEADEPEHPHTMHATLSGADQAIVLYRRPILNKLYEEQRAAQLKAREENGARIAREKDERLSKNSHRDHTMHLWLELSKQDAIDVAYGLLSYIHGNRAEDTVRLTIGTTHKLDEAEVRVGWAGTVYLNAPIIDSLAEPVVRIDPDADLTLDEAWDKYAAV